jgi:hypothetical protein
MCVDVPLYHDGDRVVEYRKETDYVTVIDNGKSGFSFVIGWWCVAVNGRTMSLGSPHLSCSSTKTPGKKREEGNPLTKSLHFKLVGSEYLLYISLCSYISMNQNNIFETIVYLWTRGMAQVVEYLPCKYKGLSSNSRTSKTKKSTSIFKNTCS